MSNYESGLWKEIESSWYFYSLVHYYTKVIHFQYLSKKFGKNKKELRKSGVDKWLNSLYLSKTGF